MGFARGIGVVREADRSTLVLVGDGDLCNLEDVLPGAPATTRELIARWAQWREPILEATVPDWARRPVTSQLSWAPPVIPAKLLCVGSNYHDHVAEMDAAFGLHTPAQPFPYMFLKPWTALVGSGATVPHPSHGRRLDFEAELAVVIGDAAAAHGPAPLEAVFGYSILNDLSLRDFVPFPHALGLDAVASKGFDGAAPMGPWITFAGAVPDPGDLAIQLALNDELMQDSSTARMIFGVPALIAHCARVLTLEPGDVIATGTPAGVGAARRSPRFLAPGDRVRAHIDGLGTLVTTIGPLAAGEPLPTSQEAAT